MNDLLYELIRRVDCLDAALKSLQQHRKAAPLLEFQIESSDVDALLTQIQKIYQNFSGGCNIQIKVKLKEGQNELQP